MKRCVRRQMHVGKRRCRNAPAHMFTEKLIDTMTLYRYYRYVSDHIAYSFVWVLLLFAVEKRRRLATYSLAKTKITAQLPVVNLKKLASQNKITNYYKKKLRIDQDNKQISSLKWTRSFKTSHLCRRLPRFPRSSSWSRFQPSFLICNAIISINPTTTTANNSKTRKLLLALNLRNLHSLDPF